MPNLPKTSMAKILKSITKYLVCSVVGCTAKHDARGYCSKHYRQMKKHGKIIDKEIALKSNKGKVCKHSGCNRNAKSSGFCRVHKAMDFSRKRKENKQCTKCGKVLDRKGTFCFACIIRVRDDKCNVIHHRRINHLCKFCGSYGNIKLNKNYVCTVHYFKSLSSSVFNTTKFADELKNLFDKQDGLCAYSRRKLILGSNAELDHKTPQKRGGNNNIENTHWVDSEINWMKSDLTHDEFLCFCAKVVDYATS